MYGSDYLISGFGNWHEQKEAHATATVVFARESASPR
jgi:hypothetical protein